MTRLAINDSDGPLAVLNEPLLLLVVDPLAESLLLDMYEESE